MGFLYGVILVMLAGCLRIIRSMYRLSRTTSCRPVFIQEKILTICSMHILVCASYVYKNLTSFKRCGEVSAYHTRISNDLYIPAARLTQVSQGPVVLSLKIFNHLPKYIKESKSLTTFRSALRKLFSPKPYYSLQEYFSSTF